MLKRIIILISFLSLVFVKLNAQEKPIQNYEEFKEKYITASYYFLYDEYQKAVPLFLELYDKNPSNAAINYKIGVCYMQIPGQREKALPFLEQASSNVSDRANEFSYKETRAPETVWYRLGEIYHQKNDFENALSAYKKFKAYLNPSNIYDLDIVNRQMQTCQNAKKIVQYPVIVVKNNLGYIMSTPFQAYNPVVSADQNSLVYTTKKAVIDSTYKDGIKEYIEEVFYSKKVNGEWMQAKNISSELGTDGFCSSVYLSNDGTHLLLMKDDLYDGNIYETKLVDGKWTPIVKLSKNVNSKYWEMHACLSKDGKIIYFSSDRKGGFGGFDIYKSELNSEGEWGKAINLGPTINTKFDDDTPFILEDGKTLYFSSEGHYNMGGFDIFHTMNLGKNKWSTPLNLGYPINTAADNLFYYPVNLGEYTYFSDAKMDESGGTEIYMMKLQLPENPNEFELSGKVTFSDKANHENIVKISVLDSINLKDTIATIYTNIETGNYESKVAAGNYQISFEADKYNKEIVNLYIPRILSRQQFVLDITLTPQEQLLTQKDLIVDANTTNESNTTATSTQKEKEGFVAIKNVHFDETKQDLDFDSQVELERIYKVLESNPSLAIHISGKSKSEFGEAYDEKLNQKRQESIINYLAAKGIDKSRFKIEDGTSTNIADNTGNVSVKLFKSAQDTVKMDEDIYKPNSIKFKDELVYTVILKGTNDKLADDYFAKYPDITAITASTTENGYVYTSGKFSKLFEAVKYMNKCIDLGFAEASIVDNFELDNIKNSTYLATSESVSSEKQKVAENVSKPINSESKSTGISFTIQLGVFSAPMDVMEFKNIGEVTAHIGEDNKYRYLFGTYDSYSKANEKLSQILKLGYTEAFIMNTERYKK